MLRFSGAGVSDRGRVRSQNEDSAFVGPSVALVADGVGGAAAGEIASASAAYAVSATALACAGRDPEAVLREAVEQARRALRRAVQEDLTRLGMATTLTVLVSDGRRVVLGQIGDSRAYRMRAGSLTRLSTDHTYVQQLVDAGRLTPTAARVHQWRHLVLRSLDGDPLGPGVDVVAVDVEPGDRLLLCSDGVTDPLPDEAIAPLLGTGDPRSAATALTEAAMAAGGTDNVTCVVLDVLDGPFVADEGEPLGALREPANVVDATGVRLPS